MAETRPTIFPSKDDTPKKASLLSRLSSPLLPKGPNVDTIAAALGYPASTQTIDPSIDLNTLKPQFENIVIPPNSPLIPPPRSSADPQQLLAEALQRRAQQTAMDVALRKQQQLEQGIGGDWPSDKMSGYYLPYNTSTSSKYITDKVPEAQLRGFERDENGTVKANFTKNVPGIGHVTKAWQKDGGEGSIMTGRYGTGSATFSDKPRTAGGTITEDGQKVPIADWFKDAARRQGESNQFNSKDGRKIVPDKVA